MKVAAPPPGFLLLPATLLILVVIVFPFAYVAGMSLFNEATGAFVGTTNFRRVLLHRFPAQRLGEPDLDDSESRHPDGVWARPRPFLNQRFYGRDAARTLFLVPFVVPTAVVALMFA